MKALIFFLVVLIIIASVAYLIWRDYKEDIRIREEAEKENAKWLEEEMKKPKYCVEFKVDQLVMPVRSKSYDPQARISYYPYPEPYNDTSKAVAFYRLTGFYNQGFFIAKDKTTYPLSRIIKAAVVEDKE